MYRWWLPLLITVSAILFPASGTMAAPNPSMTEHVMLGYRISAPLDISATAYDACVLCCGKTDGITKTGVQATPWYTVAVDPDVIPLGSKIYVPSLGRVFEAQDIGGKIKGRRMDFFLPDHQLALDFGRQSLRVYLLSPPAVQPAWKNSSPPEDRLVWAR
ncbi:3D domain-containing protein [Heliophilum fasciatum]|uniref:3D (Asp-Asp-Asp) domain-containing protein n=1 Tax=Heliophilum fasciatum TaxID=35700 RepID=A0A4R2RYP7_9FIRM|nr:3D domain-containing protein [Heliophilum fasciatum]MCW2278156.1 3D (Asp-Asp-Asp) domain-containing protein [Heliophilum fasciatum]TCP64225.1 3D (Asp-Asp-Asp) domain-containing protein [Heliophilum fasciatum]